MQDILYHSASEVFFNGNLVSVLIYGVSHVDRSDQCRHTDPYHCFREGLPRADSGTNKGHHVRVSPNRIIRKAHLRPNPNT